MSSSPKTTSSSLEEGEIEDDSDSDIHAACPLLNELSQKQIINSNVGENEQQRYTMAEHRPKRSAKRLRRKAHKKQALALGARVEQSSNTVNNRTEADMLLAEKSMIEGWIARVKHLDDSLREMKLDVPLKQTPQKRNLIQEHLGDTSRPFSEVIQENMLKLLRNMEEYNQEKKLKELERKRAVEQNYQMDDGKESFEPDVRRRRAEQAEQGTQRPIEKLNMKNYDGVLMDINGKEKMTQPIMEMNRSDRSFPGETSIGYDMSTSNAAFMGPHPDPRIRRMVENGHLNIDHMPGLMNSYPSVPRFPSTDTAYNFGAVPMQCVPPYMSGPYPAHEARMFQPQSRFVPPQYHSPWAECNAPRNLLDRTVEWHDQPHSGSSMGLSFPGQHVWSTVPYHQRPNLFTPNDGGRPRYWM